jgi:hypothetical protein
MGAIRIPCVICILGQIKLHSCSVPQDLSHLIRRWDLLRRYCVSRSGVLPDSEDDSIRAVRKYGQCWPMYPQSRPIALADSIGLSK